MEQGAPISSLALRFKTVFSSSTVKLSSIPWDFLLILIALGVFVPWRGTVRIKRLLNDPALGTSERLSLYAFTIAFQWLLAAVIAWRALARHLSPAELGLTVVAPGRTLLTAAGLEIAVIASQWAGLRKLSQLPPEKRGFMFRFTQKIMPRSTVETLVFVALACTAGMSEEFVYRGFVFAIFRRTIPGSASWVNTGALVLSSVLFALAHLYQGRQGIITTFVVGCLFAGSRIWTGNLIAPMTAHVAVDMMAGLYARRILASMPVSQESPPMIWSVM